MRPLTQYPRPSVAVDTAVLTVAPGSGVEVLLVLADRKPRLPGTFLHEDELLADAVLRSLREKAGVTGLRPQQLQVFDALNRDDRGRVLSIAHMDVVPDQALRCDPTKALRVPVHDLPVLPFDHSDIVELAVSRLRHDYEAGPDPSALLPEPFTLRQLQLLHEAVLARPVVRDTFRRQMIPALAATGETTRGTVGKPARLWRRH